MARTWFQKYDDWWEKPVGEGHTLRVTKGGLGWTASHVRPNGNTRSSMGYDTAGAAKRGAATLFRRYKKEEVHLE